MIFDKSEGDLNAWKSEMHMYEKSKRTKKPFGKAVSHVQHVTHEQIKAKQCLFNPVLQTYQKPDDELIAVKTNQQKRAKSLMNHLKQTVKYEKSFDIINLKSNEPFTEKTSIRKTGPVRNAYNVINNQRLPQFFFQNREIRLPVERQKKLLQHHTKQFDILTNIYKEDHERKLSNQKHKQVEEISKKYWNTHNYDPVFGKFYNKQKEEEFQKHRTQQQQQHGKDAEKKLPPSYVYREPFIADYTKPLPQTLKWLDEKNYNAKKRFQLKYVVLDEYQKRNFQQEAKHDEILKSHVHFGRILDEKAKQFNIITNTPYKQTRAEELYGKKPEVQSWDKLIKEASRAPPQKLIKTTGFS